MSSPLSISVCQTANSALLVAPLQDHEGLWEQVELQDPRGTKEIQVRFLKMDPLLENLENQDNQDPKDSKESQEVQVEGTVCVDVSVTCCPKIK